MKLNIAHVQPGTLNAKIMASVGYPAAIAALCGLVLSPVYAYADDVASDEASGDAIVSDQATNASVPDKKTETVYLFANADGSLKNTEVSTSLGNPYGAAELADSSELSDIENVEGDSTYSGSGSNMVWDAQGENVYYKGTTTKQAPVSVAVTYFLDGKKVAPEKVAGATGHLKVRYDYDNTATVKTNIRGTQEELYVPFTFVTALLFDNDTLKNVEVKNGKVIDDGDRVIVAGYAMPGLKKSLGDIVDDFEIPEYFELEGDVTDFEMKTSLTIATAGLLDDFDADDIDTGELEDASSELMDAMDQIIDGAGALKDGLEKLADGAQSAKTASGKLSDGADSLAAGNKQLADGLNTMKSQTGSLTDGVDQLAAGADSLADGVNNAEKGAEQLNGGASDLVDALNAFKNGNGSDNPGLSVVAKSAHDIADGVAKVKDALSELSDENKGLPAAIGGISSAQSALTGNSDKTIPATTSAISEDLESIEEILSNRKADLGDDYEKLVAVTAKAKAEAAGVNTIAKEASDGLDTVKGGLSNAATSLDTSKLDELIAGSNTLADGLDSYVTALGDEETEKTIIYGASSLNDGAKKLATGLQSASAGATQLAGGLKELQSNVPALVEGVSKVTSGADTLAEGSQSLADNLGKFDDAMDQLSDGAGSASEGSDKLVAGLEQFKDEGVGKISDLIDDDLLPFVDRLDAITQAGKDYDNFGGITKGTQGSVKFVIETDAISAE